MPSLGRIDHVHVLVADRARAETWYATTLGLTRDPQSETWTTPNGPLLLTDAGRAIKLALFEMPPVPSHAIVAFAVDAANFGRWIDRLGSLTMLVDHRLAWSLYFRDPDGNPFEIITYDVEQVTDARERRAAFPAREAS